MDVMTMISTVFNKKKPFLYDNRSKYNNLLFRELKLGIIGEGQTFGDTDASRGRNYLYTLRTHSSKSSVYSINTVEFMNHLAACSKLYELKMYQYIQDKKLINQLALNLKNYLEGLNMENRKLEN